jgi:hypothetical protein
VTTWKQQVTYNGRVSTKGGAIATFTRPAASNGHAANERRYSEFPQAACGVVDWQDSVTPAVDGYVRDTGPDIDGTPLMTYQNNTDASYDVYYWTGSTFTLAWATQIEDFPGYEGGVTYATRGGSIWYGLITVELERYESAVSKGIAYAYSQDRGENWTLVDHIDHDDYMEQNAGSSGMTPRGATFVHPEVFPLGGIGGDGSFSKLDGVVLGCEGAVTGLWRGSAG